MKKIKSIIEALPPESRRRLHKAAEAKGTTPESLAVSVLSAGADSPSVRLAARPVAFKEGPKYVSIEITGAAFEELERITAVMNKWGSNVFTPAAVVALLMKGDPLLTLGEESVGEYETTVAGALCDAFGAENDVLELRAAFEDAGLAVNG